MCGLKNCFNRYIYCSKYYVLVEKRKKKVRCLGKTPVGFRIYRGYFIPFGKEQKRGAKSYLAPLHMKCFADYFFT